MTDIITRNPFRVLGVYTNAHQREIVANAAKIRAFAKIGKSPTFPVDSINVGAPVARTEAAVQEALAAIALPKDKLAASLFWFAEVGTAEESSANGSVTEHSCVNSAVKSLLLGQKDLALHSYATLLDDNDLWRDYQHSIIGDAVFIPAKEIAHTLAETLMLSFPKINWSQYLTTNENSILGRALLSRSTTQYEKSIRDAIAKAAQTDSKDAAANLAAAKQLQSAVKSPLAALKDILGADDKKYAALADAAANQLLNNCIDYGNNTKDRDRAETILPIVRFAMELAQGMVVKERLKKNYDSIVFDLDIWNTIKAAGGKHERKRHRSKQIIYAVGSILLFVTIIICFFTCENSDSTSESDTSPNQTAPKFAPSSKQRTKPKSGGEDATTKPLRTQKPRKVIMAVNKAQIGKLYTFLKENGYTTATDVQEFSRRMRYSNYRKNLYDNIKSGIGSKTFGEFEHKLGYDKMPKEATYTIPSTGERLTETELNARKAAMRNGTYAPKPASR